MKITPLEIEGVFLVEPKRFGDNRGYFSELFKSKVFNEATGQSWDFVQDNFSYSQQKGTVRGLHFQSPPHAQGKLVRCPRGRVMDVAVDARKDSSTYGKHVAVELSAENGLQLWVPPGFLHGFATLEEDCELAYKVTDYYSPECDGGVRWNSPSLNINWGIPDSSAQLSDKDKVATLFTEFQSPF